MNCNLETTSDKISRQVEEWLAAGNEIEVLATMNLEAARRSLTLEEEYSSVLDEV